jgi:DNA topoisomerase-2
MSSKQYHTAIEQGGLHKFFKIQKTLSLNNMVLFDSKGVLKRYDSPLEILKEFYQVRYHYYEKRKEYLESMLGSESAKLDNLARFILEKIEGKIKVENLKKADLIKLLIEKGYDSDPIRRWKEKVVKEKGYLHDETNEANNNDAEVENETKDDFNYLLSMPLWNLTLEKKEEILKQQKEKTKQLKNLREKTIEQLWLDDLNEFKTELEKFEIKEKEDSESTGKKSTEKKQKAGFNVNAFLKRNSLPNTKHEYLPSQTGERVEPKMDLALVAKIEKETQQKIVVKTKKEESLKSLSLVDIITCDEKITEENLQLAKEFAVNLANPNKLKVKPISTETKVKKEKIDVDEPLNGNHHNGIENGNTNGNGKSSEATPKKAKVTKPKKEKITIDSDSEKSFDEENPNGLDSFQHLERRQTSRAVKAVKYDLIDKSDSEEEEEKEEKDIIHDKKIEESGATESEEPEPVKPKMKSPSKKKEPPKKQDEKPVAVKITESKKNTKSTNVAEKKNFDEFDYHSESMSEEDNDSDFEMSNKKKKPAGKSKSTAAGAKKKPAAPKNSKETIKRKSAEFVDTSESSEAETKPKKIPKKKKAKIAKDDESDFSLD